MVWPGLVSHKDGVRKLSREADRFYFNRLRLLYRNSKGSNLSWDER